MKLSPRSGTAAIALVAIFSNLLSGCADPGTPPIGAREDAVVYGVDDRLDVYAHPDPVLRALAADSIVALMFDTSISQNADGSWSLVAAETLRDATLGEELQLCDDGTQRFLDQPTVAYCSGTLVAPDIVLTAGHCISNETPCATTTFVFDYLYTAENTLATIDADDVYSCAEVLSRAEDGSVDYAFLRLDRPVVGHTPATIARDGRGVVGRVQQGDSVSVLGFGTGLPLKIDNGGTVINASTYGGGFFRTSLDTFAGNSGSGVFNVDGELVGVLSSGLEDYVPNASNTCMIVNVLPESQGGEEIGHVLDPLKRLCRDPEADASLCAGVDESGGSSCSLGSRDASSPSAPWLLGALGLGLAIRRRRREARA